MDQQNSISTPLGEKRRGLGIPYAWGMIVWLWFAHFLNQADRQVYSIVLPQLSADLHITAVQAGLVATLFTAALALTVPLGGWAGDRFDRKKIIVICLTAWSASTVFSGLSTSVAMLIAVRSLASAAGEAFYTPAAFSLIASYHVKNRSRAMSVHQTAVYIGIISSGFLAGWIADQWGWRHAFVVFGGAGLLLAGLLQIFLRPAPAPKTDKHDEPSLWEAAAMLAKTPTFWWLSVAFGCMAFVNVGFLTWIPTYLHEQFHLNLAHAGFTSMFWHHVAAVVGVLIGGWLSDRLARGNAVHRLDLQGTGLLLGAPFIIWIGHASSLTLVIAALIGFGLFRGIYDSNIYTSLYEIVPQRYHSTASGLMIACAFLFGSMAPVVLGYVRQTMGLGTGFFILGLVYAVGGLGLWTGGHRCFAADRARANTENLTWRTQA